MATSDDLWSGNKALCIGQPLVQEPGFDPRSGPHFLREEVLSVSVSLSVSLSVVSLSVSLSASLSVSVSVSLSVCLCLSIYLLFSLSLY